MNNQKKHIHQYAPTLERPNYCGVFGWGFDTNGYRIVVYGDAKTDHPYVREVLKELAHRDANQNLIPSEFTNKIKQRQKNPPRRMEACPRGGEHGPAHVHVFHIQSGRETRFSLLEHHNNDHLIEPLFTSPRRHGSLTPNEIEAIKPILKSHAAEFIQLWRELYCDEKLSRYVLRVSKYGSKEMLDSIDPDGWQTIQAANGSITRIPPPNLAIHEPQRIK